MSDELEVHTRDRTWTFTLNRPQKLNALNAGLVDALIDAVARAHEAQARLLVFRGAGKSFSAGFDLSDLEVQSEGDLVLRFARIEMLLQAIAASPTQTMALAHGKVFGAGVDLFAVCRHRIATAETVFRMPGLKFGLVLGTRRFGDIVGHERARRVLEQTSSFSAPEAEAMGFATHLADTADWDRLIQGAETAADALEDSTRSTLYRVLRRDEDDRDLATLVRSAARAGLKSRLKRYLDAQRATS